MLLYRRISLKDNLLMATYKNPSVGDIIRVRISGIKSDLGAFARMPNGVDGLIRLNDIAWSNQPVILSSLSVGDILDVKVIKELPDGKLNLSRKDLLPNPRTVEKGTIYKVTIKSVESFGLIVNLGDGRALVHKSELPQIDYSEGEEITCVVIDNTYDAEKHRNKISMSVLALHDYYAKTHNENERIKCLFKGTIQNENSISAVVEADGLVRVVVPSKRFIEPYKTKLVNDEIAINEELEFVYLKYNEKSRTIVFDMRPIEAQEKKAKVDWLRSQLNKGDIVDAIVKNVNNKMALVDIGNTGILCNIDRDELSPNKVVRASDEVFQGEHIRVVYIGENNGELVFSRRFLVENKYDENLYELSLADLLTTMGLTTNRFVGKVIEINSYFFVTNLMSSGDINEENNGKLLLDPINGKCLIVVVDNRLRNFFVPGNYYEIEIDMARKEYRIEQGSPYMFCVLSNKIKEVENPYKESVCLSFKQHTSPNTNTSVANLLREVGQNLYTSKKRMFFELLQNADDAAPENGVKVKLQLSNNYFVLTHDGFAFNKHDFESITSAAKSTKSVNKKKTGYKGIGFKSVFTNSESVLIKSAGYNFSFDKSLPVYNDFKAFYFHVNDIEEDVEKQKEFLHKYAKYQREFNGVKDIPWQLLPIWYESLKIDATGSIFNQKENVAIALKMDEETLSEYNDAIKEVFSEPRFMLFLRNTNRVQLIDQDKCLTIQKNIDRKNNTVSLVNSFNEDHLSENFCIFSSDNILVNDDEFKKAGVQIKRKERINNRGENENYFVKLDQDGNELTEVDVPDRIASAIETTISFAIRLDEEGHVMPIGKEELSLYAYLPMNEHRFKFPFYLNADFIPKSDREGIQSDNPWNYFLFYTIGKLIVSMVANYASENNANYLNLLPTKELSYSSQDTAALVDSFNRGYKDALTNIPFILNDINEVVGPDNIIFDASGLSTAIGASSFYRLIGTTKHLPHVSIDSNSLSKDIFGIEKITTEAIISILENNLDTLKKWVIESSDELRTSFYEWLAKEEKAQTLIPLVPTFMFGEEWKTTSEINIEDKLLISTEKISTIKPVLSKLGFKCSNHSIEDHPLSLFIDRQDEKSIFEKIKNDSLDLLTYSERLQLFVNISKFENIGVETLKKWEIFKNQNGNYCPLSSMFAYNPNCPVWLNNHMLKQEENNEFITKYLVASTEIYSKIIEPCIDELVGITDLSMIHKTFLSYWRPGFTTSLFSKNNIPTASLLHIVEKSGPDTQAAYASSFKAMPLLSTSDYDKESFEYRWMKMALSNDNSITYARSIITIDGKSLSEYNLKDDFSIKIEDNVYTFSLSQILPSYSSSSILSNVSSKFYSIDGYEKIFAQREVNPTDVQDQLRLELSESTQLITAEQFCFLVVYRRSCGYNYFDPRLKACIRANNKELFIKILDKSMALNIADMLSPVIANGGVQYPFSKLIGTYFDSNEYTLPIEQVPSFIGDWANTAEKKQFLIRLGLHDNESKEIQRRKSFKEDKLENVWNINDTNIIRSFLNWIANTFQLPIESENQVSILKNLYKTLRLTGEYNEEDFCEAAEWSNQLYLDWKQNSKVSIYIIEGELPYRGFYNNTYLFKGYGGEYTYFRDSRHIYITANREPASSLADIYSNSTLRCPFTKEDWNKIFLVSANIVQEKDERIAELERLLEYARRNDSSNHFDDPEVDEHGKYTEKDNTDQETRKQINLEARFAAKDYLDCLEDYDCSEWNPEDSGQIIEGVIRYKGKPITVAITSSRGRKLYLHPWVFTEIMEDPDNLLLNYGFDKCIHSLRFKDIFMDNPDVNLIFDTDVINPKLIADLSNQFRGSKHTCFVIENPKYSQSDAIQSFGLNEKKEDGYVDLGFSDDDIFNY